MHWDMGSRAMSGVGGKDESEGPQVTKESYGKGKKKKKLRAVKKKIKLNK